LYRKNATEGFLLREKENRKQQNGGEMITNCKTKILLHYNKKLKMVRKKPPATEKHPKREAQLFYLTVSKSGD